MTGKKTMAALLLFPATLNAATVTMAIGHGQDKGPCAELVERFLNEYREIIPHSRIVLDAPGGEKGGADRFELQCNGDEGRITLKGAGDERFSLRYQSAAQSFDAADWVPLQKRMREPAPELASLSPGAPNPSAMPGGKPGQSVAQEQKKPWWPWVVAGVLGAGAVAATVVLLNQGPGHTHVGTR